MSGWDMPEPITLYCPSCVADSNDWKYAYYSRKYREIVGCDACIADLEDDEPDECPVCHAKGFGKYIVKETKEIIGCDSCIVACDYDYCLDYHKGEME